MSDNTIEEIKSRLDIEDVVKEYVELEKVGSNMRALCPFHAEKTPSFFISPSRQSWRCFGGCNEGGDIFDFVMKIEGIEFYEALKILGKKAGVEIKKKNPKKTSKRNRLYEINELATKFFEKQLEGSKKGRMAKNYLLDRGMSEESIKKWRLGYSPDSWQALSEFLISKGYKRDEIVEAGLAVKKEDHSYDRFRGRIIFPIKNKTGKPIAFGGRIFGEDKDTAKYLNSPQTELYDKSKVLYGLDFAKVAARRVDKIILVEGYTDVIMSHQAGVENTISTSGTALTEEQLKIIKRYTNNLLISFDTDDAGTSATKKGINMARDLNFDIEIISLPIDSDPADIIKEDAERWREAVQKSKDIVAFYFESSFRNRDCEDPKEKRKIAEEFLPVLKKIPNRIEQSHWIKKLSERINVDEEAIREQLSSIEAEKKGRKIRSKRKQKKKTKSRRRILEEKILSFVSKDPKKLELIDDFDSFSKEIKEILKAIEEGKEDERTKKIIDYFALKPERGVVDEKEEFKYCLNQIEKEKIKSDLKNIQKKIKKAENNKNTEKLKRLTEEAYKLSKKLSQKQS